MGIGKEGDEIVYYVGNKCTAQEVLRRSERVASGSQFQTHFQANV